MISISDISIFLILLFTFLTGGENIVFLTLIFFSYYVFRKLTFDKFLITKDTLILIIFATLYPLSAILNYSLNFSNIDLVEWKVFITIIILSLISIEKENTKISNLEKDFQIAKNHKLGNLLFLSIVVFSIICIFQVYPSFFRFSDYAPAAEDIISNYFGFICLFAASLVKKNIFKYILYFLILIGGGGSAVVGLIIYITTYYLTKKDISFNKKIIPTVLGIIVSFSILFPTFQYTQLQRGRNIRDFKNIDRFIILRYFNTYLKENFRASNYFFGVGPDNAIDIKNIMERYTTSSNERAVGKYLVRRFDVVSGKSLHNDYLRVFLHYGFLGLFIFLRYTYKLFSYDIAFYFSFLFISFFNGIASSTFCSSIIIIIFLIKGFKELSIKKNSLT